MRAYIEFGRKKFLNNMVYRFDYIMGILNTLLMFIIFNCIYKTLYGTATEINGVTFSMVSTNFILALGLSSAFKFDDEFVQYKLKDGSIVNEFIKPVNFKLRILAENLGDSFFGICFNFLPALIITLIFTKIEKPAGAIALVLFGVSVVLGYLILWHMSFIVQMLAFWLLSVWSISTIKKVFINVLSGSMIPLWFMPEKIMNIISYTPFDSIYFTPVKLYLGQMQKDQILFNFGRQLFWIVILYLIGNILWKFGQKRLIVQGG